MRGLLYIAASAALHSSSLSAAVGAGSICFSAPHDGNCLSWTVASPNITLTATFVPDPSSPGVPVWGAWGLPALDCGNMWPSHVWLALPSPSGGVRIEDRVATAHAAPACAKAPQLSHTLSGSVAADGSVTVSWTRPLAPPRQYKQPAIAGGAAPLIGAYSLGAAALAFPACGVAGLPFHSNVLNGVSADFLAAGRALAPPPPAPVSGARAAPYAGLAGLAAVCGDACAAVMHLDAQTGGVAFASPASPPLFPLLTALDAPARTVYALAFNNSEGARSGALFVASLSADTGALLGVCATPFPLNDGFDLASLNFAFDAALGEVLIASCADSACVAPLNVSALHPGSCALRPVAALAVEELTVGGSGAVDPYARVLVLSLARGGAKPGLAVVALNISTGAVVRVTPESADTPSVQSMVFDDVSRLVFGLAFTTAGSSPPTLVAIDARTGKLRTVAPVAGCAGALPDSLAASADGERLFFVGAAADGAPTLFAIFSANATVASAAPLQGALSLGDAPSALFWLPGGAI